MKKGILGRKIGMTQVFAKNGKLTPVTVIAVEPNFVSQIKTVETDGYNAIQLAAFDKREKLSNKPEMGHLKKANVTINRKMLAEIAVNDAKAFDRYIDVYMTGAALGVLNDKRAKQGGGTDRARIYADAFMTEYVKLVMQAVKVL